MIMSLKTILRLRNVAKYRVVNFIPLAIRNFSEGKTGDQHPRWTRNMKITGTVLLGSVLVGSAITNSKQMLQKSEQDKPEPFEAGNKRPDLPTFRAEEVSKHDSKKSFWVTYKHGVYDVTKFLPSHPGGEQILNAAGLSIEPFWNVYGMHKTQDVLRLLESYRIGNLHDDDVADHTDDELWAREPYRDRRLVVRTDKPFNAEIPPQLQVEHFDTPNELFYVRQHMPVPDIDAASHRVRVIVKRDGEREYSREFSLDELEKLPQITVRAALMCAGNRRSEMNEVKPVKGISWATGAVSNAVWRGAALRDVLAQAGVDLEHTEGMHVIFTGADVDATGEHFSTSIPLHMACEASSRVVVATRMNGAPLPPDHGRPLRVVVPGAPAVRSVKWLESITVSKDESSSHWHQKDYRSFNASTTWETADFARAPPLYSLPVTSAICSPRHADTVRATNGCIQLKGYAYSGGGARVLRVDVSGDRGRSWRQAAARAQDAAPPGRHYSWLLWDIDLPVDEGQDEVEIWVKATDSNFNTQPEKFDDIWNIRGILSNAYHKIKVKIQH